MEAFGTLLIFRLKWARRPTAIEYTTTLADTMFALHEQLTSAVPRAHVVYLSKTTDDSDMAWGLSHEIYGRYTFLVKRAAIGHPLWTPPQLLQLLRTPISYTF